MYKLSRFVSTDSTDRDPAWACPGNGTMPLSKKPYLIPKALPNPVLTQIYDTCGITWPQWVNCPTARETSSTVPNTNDAKSGAFLCRVLELSIDQSMNWPVKLDSSGFIWRHSRARKSTRLPICFHKPLYTHFKSPCFYFCCWYLTATWFGSIFWPRSVGAVTIVQNETLSLQSVWLQSLETAAETTVTVLARFLEMKTMWTNATLQER